MHGQLVRNDDGGVFVCEGRAIRFDDQDAADCVCEPRCQILLIYLPRIMGACDRDRQAIYVCEDAVCSNGGGRVGDLLPESICSADEWGGTWCYDLYTSIHRDNVGPDAFIIEDEVFCGACNPCPEDPPCPCGCSEVCETWDGEHFCCYGAYAPDPNDPMETVPTWDFDRVQTYEETVDWQDGCGPSCVEQLGQGATSCVARRRVSESQGDIQYGGTICTIGDKAGRLTIYQCDTLPGGFLGCTGCDEQVFDEPMGTHHVVLGWVPTLDTGWVTNHTGDCGAFSRERTYQTGDCFTRQHVHQTEGFAVSFWTDGNGDPCCSCSVYTTSIQVTEVTIYPGPDPMNCCSNCRTVYEGGAVGVRQQIGMRASDSLRVFVARQGAGALL